MNREVICVIAAREWTEKNDGVFYSIDFKGLLSVPLLGINNGLVIFSDYDKAERFLDSMPNQAIFAVSEFRNPNEMLDQFEQYDQSDRNCHSLVFNPLATGGFENVVTIFDYLQRTRPGLADFT